jgi:glycosyltransferase involved in cell wall biosynthesis
MIPLRVLHVCPPGDPVASEAAAVVGRWMAGAGHAVLAAADQGDWTGGEVLPAVRGPLGWFTRAGRLHRAKVQAFAPDLIQVHGCGALRAGLRLQRRLRAPLVLWLHEEPPRRDAALVRDRRIAWVVAGSEHLRAVAAADLRVPRDRIALLPAACERVQAGTRSVDGRLAVGIDADRHGERLLEDLAAGLADLRRAGVSLRLVAVADGPRLRALRRGAGELQLQVLPSGAGRTAALVQASDLVLHMPEREGHLLPVRLAMAMGRVAVVAGAGGAGELVRDGIDGRVVAPGNVESAIDAIRDLADAPVRRRQGQAAAVAAGNWSAAVVGEALIALYHTALGGGSVAQAATGSWCRRQTTRRHDPIGAGSDGTAPEAGLP